MMKNLKKRLIIVLLIAASSKAFALDPLWTVPTTNLQNSNPAFVGQDSSYHVNYNFRNQWPEAAANGFFTNVFSLQKGLPHKLLSGVGVSIYNDNLDKGFIRNRSAHLNLSQTIFNNDQLSINTGIGLGIFANYVDYTRSVFFSNTPQEFKTTNTFFDLRIGTVIKYKNLRLSSNIDHVPTVDYDVRSNPNMLVRVFSDYQFDLNKSLALIPQFVLTNQSEFSVYNGGIRVKYKFAEILAGYQSNDSFYTGLFANFKGFQLYYIYEHLQLELSNISLSTHEAGMTVNLEQLKKKSK